MIEAIAIIAIGALILLYAQRLSDKKTIEQQDYKLRRYEGRTNAQDEEEAKRLQDWYHFDKIMRQLRSEDRYSQFEPEEIIKQRAKAKFREIYGYEYNE
ncbi:MAG: hypothetical protein HDS30_03405 [Bacteroides sp.]|nr:hypothetical protein [Bacteroides sp.]